MTDLMPVAPFMARSEPCPHRRGRVDCEHCRVRLISVCAALEIDELTTLARLAQPVHFDARETLLAEGDVAVSVYNITCGTVRLYRVFSDGRRQVLGFLLPGDFLGLSLAEHHDFSADAVGPVTACRFSRAEFSTFVDRKPHLLRRLHEHATHEIGLAHEQMMALGRRSAAEKVAWFLLHLRERRARIEPASDIVALPMSRQDIADFLGLTIETVSRTFSHFARQKWITIVPNGAHIADVRKLRALSEA